MQRINGIIHSTAYQYYIEQNRLAERERQFCRHGFDHQLDVARIAYIYLLEHHPELIRARDLSTQRSSNPSDGLAKEAVYAAGLLHDIGRWVEYQTGEDHAKVSARLAQPLLLEYGFTEAETEMVLEAILHHRQKDQLDTKNPLVRAIALADVWSRDCVFCQARSQCKKADLAANWTLKN